MHITPHTPHALHGLCADLSEQNRPGLFLLLSWQTLFAGIALECLAACYAYKRYREIDTEGVLPTTAAKPVLQDADDAEDDEHIDVDDEDSSEGEWTNAGADDAEDDEDDGTQDTTTTTTTAGKPRKSTIGAWRTSKLTEMTTAP